MRDAAGCMSDTLSRRTTTKRLREESRKTRNSGTRGAAWLTGMCVGHFGTCMVGGVGGIISVQFSRFHVLATGRQHDDRMARGQIKLAEAADMMDMRASRVCGKARSSAPACAVFGLCTSALATCTHDGT